MSRRNHENWFEEALAAVVAAVQPSKPISHAWHRPSNKTKDVPHFQTQARTFSEQAHYGTNAQDLIDRLTSFMAAAKAVAQRSSLYRKYKLAELEKLEKIAISFIEKEIELPTTNLHSLDSSDQEKFLKKYKANFNLYKKQMEKWFSEVLTLLVDSDDVKAAKLTRLEIQEEERQQTAKAGRHSILHRFALSYKPPESSADPHTGTYISAHQVVGQLTQDQIDRKVKWEEFAGQSSGHEVSKDRPYYTNPSTIRNTEGVSNFLRTTFARQNNTGKHTLLFEGYRHSSLTPIGVDDRIHRHANAFRQAKQLAIQIARNKLTKLPGSANVHVEISSASLLSNNVVESHRRNENESKQIAESTMALRYLNGREIETEIDGKTVTILVDTNNITMGCNNLRNAPASFFKRTIQAKINDRGFVRHSKSMLDFLLNINNKPSDLSKKLRNLLEELNFNGRQPNECQIQHTEGALKTAYTELEVAANQYEDAVTVSSGKLSKAIAEAKAHYEAKEKVVKDLETQLDDYYLDLKKQRKNLWNNAKSALKEAINDLFASGDEAKIDYANILQLFYDLNALYFERNGTFQFFKNYASNEYYFQFQARFLISSYLIGRIPDFFCKSGEDRTGRTENIILELLACCNLTNRFPAFDDKEKKTAIEEQLSPVIHTYAASRETTGLNAKGSRGLQVKDSQGSKHLSTGLLDRKIAQTAKKIYQLDNAVFKENFRTTMPNKKGPVAVDITKETNTSALNLVNRTNHLLSKTNLTRINKQLSDYLWLISHGLNSSKQATKLLNDIKSEISPKEYQNPWMKRIEELIQHGKKLKEERERLIKLIHLKINLKLNKKRLIVVNHGLKKISSPKFRAIFKKYKVIEKFLELDNFNQPKEKDTLKAEVKALAPSALYLVWGFPFIQSKPEPCQKPRKLLKRLQTSSKQHVYPNIKRLLLANLNEIRAKSTECNTALQKIQELDTTLNSYGFSKAIEDTSSIEDLKKYYEFLERFLEAYDKTFKKMQQEINDKKESLTLLKGPYDDLRKGYEQVKNPGDTLQLIDLDELLEKLNKATTEEPEGMAKIKVFRQQIDEKIKLIKRTQREKQETLRRLRSSCTRTAGSKKPQQKDSSYFNPNAWFQWFFSSKNENADSKAAPAASTGKTTPTAS